MRRLSRLLAAPILLCLPLLANAAEAPRVVVSVKPLHSLVSAVMQGVGEPALLIKGAASPHGFALRPSDAKLLDGARIVFWVGPDLETSLEKPLAALAGHAARIPLSGAPGIGRLPARTGGVWGEGDRDHDGHGHGGMDPHLWLDPVNAMVMVNAAAAALSLADPANAETYATNRTATIERLRALETDLRARLAPLSGRPYIVYHDAYQYLESRFGLRAVGSVAVTAGHGVGAGRLSALRHLIEHEGAVCLFSEPQFQPKLVDILAAGTVVRTGVLDPLGADIAPGPDHYFRLMDRLAASLATCLAP